jgi:FixJ family two-component response regulator
MAKKLNVIAVVDNDPGMRKAMGNLLSALGYGTELFESGGAFLDAACTSEAICLVVDIQLGDISGIELGRHLAAAGLKFPIIFMSALDGATILGQATALGCVAYLRKPFSAALLVDAIVKATGRVTTGG